MSCVNLLFQFVKMGKPQSKKEYKTQFIKGGLTPKEFERCLGKKVELLTTNLPNETKNLIEEAKRNVKQQICFRENETDPLTIDQRNKISLRNHEQEGILTGGQHPKRRVEETSGQRGVQRIDKVWPKKYHKEQYTFFTRPFIQDILRSEFRQIRVNQRGNLLNVFGKQLSPKEFCCVLDHITADLVEELSTLIPDSHDNNYTDRWKQRLDPVSKSCKKISMLRLVLDFCRDNDLMDQKGYEVWRKHLMVIMSFAAMLVVANAFIDSLNKNWGPTPPPKSAKSAQICPTPLPNANGRSNIKALAWFSLMRLVPALLFYYSQKRGLL